MALYSIGHGTKKAEDLIAELEAFGIRYVVDVRSKPLSRWHPQFNRQALADTLKAHGITYIFSGDTLGGRPPDSRLYGPDGRIDYNLLKEEPSFKEGLHRLIAAHEQDLPVAVLCSESKPETCHRFHLIGRELLQHGISLQHITGRGQLKTQEAIARQLGGGPGLFDEL